MAKIQEKTMYDFWVYESKSVVTVKRHFRLECSKRHVPSKDSIISGTKNLRTRKVWKIEKLLVKHRLTTEDVDRMMETFMRNLSTSTSLQLKIMLGEFCVNVSNFIHIKFN
ncbi:hypothetical protein NPIL_661 [Nephila pilipes]|uniref:DUF4817 domain-containing protein n=1 Tax=Nephila pilipes TaxID=299642 RepID=A0A8X6JH91_NEPPI|nr:hypothetical protein NPIL_661 [Nephila pilipes]